MLAAGLVCLVNPRMHVRILCEGQKVLLPHPGVGPPKEKQMQLALCAAEVSVDQFQNRQYCTPVDMCRGDANSSQRCSQD